jgi:hypothetical protein
MLTINGVGDGINGSVHPDREVKNLYCERCKEETPFIKKIGAKSNFIFWIPLPTKEKEITYWECCYCSQFIYYDDPQSQQK